MTHLLAITSSPKAEGSVSNALVQDFVDNWISANREMSVTRRDVGLTPPPHLDGATIGSIYTPPDQRDEGAQHLIAFSDTLVEELEAADVIVIGAPMHNFGLPSGLKTWIDHIARVGRTFAYTEAGPKGMLSDKKVFVLGARGGNYSPDSPAHGMDFVTPYLRAVLGFIGLDDVTFIHAEGVASGGEGIAIAHEAVKSAVTGLAA
ncbi:MAG: NAD(P)H-dependent oxidoreductase [Rhodospirillales bacterium]|nr:NAD(P)H-dependent oxidoreductase [Rhodospirillales bacterium]